MAKIMDFQFNYPYLGYTDNGSRKYKLVTISLNGSYTPDVVTNTAEFE